MLVYALRNTSLCPQIGDAAGHIDPLTGEGIHTAMMGGKAAAQTMLDMRSTGDYTKQSCKQYERRWVQ